jgi:class 3 adenylate cyclase
MATSVVGSVVFLKIAEFARRSASEQARLRAQLEAVIAVVTAEVPPANRLVLEAADGMAIVFLRDPQAALRVASRALTAGAAGLPLAAGLNHGALQLSGRKGAEGMTGDGIAVAANIADFAESSRVLASRAFRDALAEASPGREALLRPAGTFTDAGLRSHEAFMPDQRAIVGRKRRYGAVALVLTIAFAAGGLGWRAQAGRPPFVDMVLAKYTYLHGLVQRARY